MNCEDVRITINYQEPGPRGEKGWTALYADESFIDSTGKLRIIRKLTAYVDGQGTEPTEGLGLYLTEGGQFTDDKEAAFDYKGFKGDKPAHNWNGTALSFENPDGSLGEAVNLKGEKGNAGWTEDYLFEVYGEKVIKKLVGYSGGSGDAPEDNIGLYVSLNGFTDNKDEAINFKGEMLTAIFSMSDKMVLSVTTN
jgi:hypothetical protein